MKFHVFVERTQDPSPAGRQRVAAALAQRYGLNAQNVFERLNSGRFAAWSDLDFAQARQAAADLEACGAICSVVQDGAAPPAPAAAAVSRTSLPTPAAAPAPSGNPGTTGYASGLAAAYGNAGPQDLGALGGSDQAGGVEWKLARLDGADEEMPTSIAQRRPPAASPSPSPSASPRTKPVSAPPSTDAGWAGDDPFLPPEMAREKEHELQLDGVEPAARIAAPPPATSQRLAPPRVSEAPPVQGASLHQPSPLAGLLERLAGADRLRFVVGVGLALLLGFVPASILASRRASSSSDEILGKVHAADSKVDSPESWEALDDVRAEAASLLSSRRTNIAISSAFVWVLLTGGLFFVWWRVIDWDRFAGPRLAIAPARRRPRVSRPPPR